MSFIYEDCYRYRSNGAIAAGVAVPLFTDLACTTPASPSSVTTDSDGFGLFSSAAWPIYYKVAGDSEGHRALCVNPPGSGGAGATGVFNVTDPAYGAYGDSSHDDTAAIQAALTAAAAHSVGVGQGGAVVFFPPGVYMVTPTASPSLTVPPRVTIKGSGTRTTFLKKTADGVLLDFSGTPPSDSGGSTTVWSLSQGIEDICLSGNSHAGYLIRTYYVGSFHANNVLLGANADVCWSGCMFQDSEMFHTVFDTCGSASVNAPNLQLYTSYSATPRAMGYGPLGNNDLHWYGTTFFNPMSGAIEIGLGVGSANNWAIRFTDLKIEPLNVAVNTPAVNITNGVAIDINHFYLWLDSYLSNAQPGGSPIDGIYFKPISGSVSHGVVGSGSATNCQWNRPVYAFADYGIEVHDIWGQFTRAPVTNAVVTADGTQSAVNPRGMLNCYNITNYSSTGLAIDPASPFTQRFNYQGTSQLYVAYSATVTPDPSVASCYVIGQLTGSLTIANPPVAWPGATLTIVVVQDSGTPRTVSFGNLFKTNGTFPSATLSSWNSISFVWGGGMAARWVQTAMTTGM